MKQSLKTGLSFGLTSGVITTLGLMVGLYAGTRSLPTVVAGVITIAIADALSDALGIHIAEESRAEHPVKEIWEATFATLVSKAVIALSFLVPILTLPLPLAVWTATGWGMLLLLLLSHHLARSRREAVVPVVAEHLGIGLLVIMAGYLIGEWVAQRFG